MLSLLVECNIVLLKILYEMFQTQRITRQEFLENSKLKIGFLMDNIGKIKSDAERSEAEEVLLMCSSVNSDIVSDCTFCLSTQNFTNLH